MGVDDYYVIRDGRPRHVRGDTEAGLDLTTFLRPTHFMQIVDDYDLAYRHLEREVAETSIEYHIWADDRVLLVTTENPILGDIDEVNASAGLIGIEGDSSTVRELYADIIDSAVDVATQNPTARQFV